MWPRSNWSASFSRAALEPPAQDRIGVPEAGILIEELNAFKTKITVAGNETFGSWRERDHDDLVLAVVLALWPAENAPRGRVEIH